ncbi:tyrosinase/peptidase [Candidatus Magnetomorum sp. HK-1]|nr:tyrosinase/peptidase [Candidatus Magnetomorum sp. HK-1]
MIKYCYSTLYVLFIFFLIFITQPAFADDHGNNCNSATSVNIGSVSNGRIDSGGDYDYFRIQMRSSGTLTVYTSGSTDTYGYLFSSSCRNLASNDDSGAGYNFRIQRSVNSGVYYVKVKHYNSRNTGNYRFHVESSSQDPPNPTRDDHGNSISSATRINANTTVNGNIERGGDLDFFRIQVSTPGNLKIFTIGSTDTYGYLKNSSGNNLTSNDDSGPGSNFQINKSVTPGTYYIATKHYSSS